jgi:hypothetical protein
MNDVRFAARAGLAALAVAIAMGLAAAPALAAAEPTLVAQAAGDDKAEMAFWDSIKDSKNPDEYRAYLDTYPKGKFSALARVRMDSLKKPAAAKPAAAPAAAASSSSSNLPQLPGQSGGAQPAAAQPAAQTAPAAAPAKEEPKIEYWTASKDTVRIYPEPTSRTTFLRDDYYVSEQAIKVVEIVPGKKKLPWLKVITPNGKTGYVFSGEARPPGVSRSGKPIQSVNMDD